MAFVLKQTDRYSWPVQIEIPVDGGRHDRQTFDAEFKRLPQSRIEEIMEGADKADLNFGVVADEILVGWKGVSDDKGDEFPFSEGNKAMMLEVPMLSASVVKAWLESLAGAKKKN